MADIGTLISYHCDYLDVLTYPEVKAQVKSLKVELKSWEHTFLADKGRKPQKDDIVQDKVIGKHHYSYLIFA